MTVKLHPMAAESKTFLTRVHDAALKRLMAKLPLAVRKEWQGEAKQDVTLYGGMSLKLILTHKCGFCVSHTRGFLDPSGSIAVSRRAGEVLADVLYKSINNHKCSGREAPHLTIVKPWLCPICGVTDEKYPEWEGECNHARVDDSSRAKSKNRRARARIGGRKGPAKARRKAVAKASRGD